MSMQRFELAETNHLSPAEKVLKRTNNTVKRFVGLRPGLNVELLMNRTSGGHRRKF